MSTREPYAQRFTLFSDRQPDGTVRYAAVEAGLELPDAARESMEGMTREHFRRLHPGVDIAGERWDDLYGGALDPDDDGTDACGHGDGPDETCEGCHG